MSLLPPTELYRWTLGSTVIRETNSLLSQTFSGNTYAPRSIRRSSIEVSSDQDAAKLTVTVPRDHEVAAQFVALPPDRVQLEVFQKRDGSFVRIWFGRVTNVGWKGNTATLTAEPPLTIAKQRGLRAMFQTGCRHRLADHRCGVLFLGEPLRKDFTVASVTGAAVELTGFATFIAARVTAYPANGANWFVGGTFEVGGQLRQILSHASDTVTLHAPIAGLEAGNTATLRAGCSHALAECHAKFANASNFGGFPYKPPQNPFGRAQLNTNIENDS